MKRIRYAKREKAQERAWEQAARVQEDIDDSNGEVTPPFDAFRGFVGPMNLREAMKAAKKVDSSVEEALGEVLGDTMGGQETLESIDAYFKGVWTKHHG